MDPLSGLFIGLKVAFTLENLFYCLIGCFLGTLTGVLPGFGPAAATALVFPVTLYLSPASAIIMLAGIYYGAMYGGSTTSILVNVPGEAASVITCLDGYQMALQGRAGPALGIAAFGSFIAGTLSVVGLMFLATPLSTFALHFTSTDYVSLVLFGMTLLCFVGSGSRIKAFIASVMGILLGVVGTDPVTSSERYTFGIDYLMDGLGLVPIIVGLFGISEVLRNLEGGEFGLLVKGKIRNLLPSIKDWAASVGPILRGTIIGFFYGIMPGGSNIIASIVSYTIEKRVSKHPEEFGRGAIQGVAGPEAANNATSTSAFIPLLTLGLPTNAIMAILMAALMVNGVSPGPFLISKRPDVFWGVIASMYVGNIFLLALNLPLIGIWVRVLQVPSSYLQAAILLLCLIGSFAINNSTSDIGIMIFFGLFGFMMKKFDYEPAPLLFAYVLAPILEDNFRRSLTVSEGSFLVFFTRPISLFFLMLSILVLISPMLFKMIARIRNNIRRKENQ